MNYVLQVLFILVLMLLGFFARKRGMISAVGTSEMVRVLIAIIYPCLIFSSVGSTTSPSLVSNTSPETSTNPQRPLVMTPLLNSS